MYQSEHGLLEALSFHATVSFDTFAMMNKYSELTSTVFGLLFIEVKVISVICFLVHLLIHSCDICDATCNIIINNHTLSNDITNSAPYFSSEEIPEKSH